MSQSLPTLSKRPADEASGDRTLRHEHAIDTIPEPEPVHIQDIDGVPEDEREAVDLHTPAEQTARQQKRRSRVLSPTRSSTYGGRLGEIIARLWRHNIAISVPHVDCRDHLGMFAILFAVYE
jgi:hypothetical protein